MILPCVGVQVPYTGRGVGTHLHAETVWIRLIHRITAVARLNVILVARSLTEVANKALPNSRIRPHVHWMGVRIPSVEIADYRDALRIRRPNREMDPAPAALLHDVRAHPLIGAVMSTFGKQI